MQYRAFEPDIDVTGGALMALIGGFGPMRAIVDRMLHRDGLVDHDAPGGIDANAWYPQQALLDALYEIDRLYGTEVLFNIGAEMPNNAAFPSSVVDAHSAIAAIDVTYHLSHRRAGQVMFDPTTGVMLEGIGHYGYDSLSPTHILSTCITPYPCEFDLGIVATMARRYEPRAIVEHVGTECRRLGAQACTYSLRWG